MFADRLIELRKRSDSPVSMSRTSFMELAWSCGIEQRERHYTQYLVNKNHLDHRGYHVTTDKSGVTGWLYIHTAAEALARLDHIGLTGQIIECRDNRYKTLLTGMRDDLTPEQRRRREWLVEDFTLANAQYLATVKRLEYTRQRLIDFDENPW
jgi:hypothetical protein